MMPTITPEHVIKHGRQIEQLIAQGLTPPKLAEATEFSLSHVNQLFRRYIALQYPDLHLSIHAVAVLLREKVPFEREAVKQAILTQRIEPGRTKRFGMNVYNELCDWANIPEKKRTVTLYWHNRRNMYVRQGKKDVK